MTDETREAIDDLRREFDQRFKDLLSEAKRRCIQITDELEAELILRAAALETHGVAGIDDVRGDDR